MANEHHIEILKSGPVAWNKWRRTNPNVVPDLSHAELANSNLESHHLKRTQIGYNLQNANLSHSKLHGISMNDADLTGANLSCSNLVNAHLFDCNFTYADFSQAGLGGADFHSCDLRMANFSGCSADYTNFADAWLDGATFNGGIFYGTIFPSNDLSGTLGLETIESTMPCVLGFETIVLSKGRIPESFLRACGVPDNFIEYLPSLIGGMTGIQFYSCFISYSSRDDQFVRRLHSRMRDERLRVWFAPEDLKAGRKTHEQIDEAIRVFDKLLVVLSENSLKSEWVMTEIRRARKRERETGKRKLFPIRLVDFDTLQGWECFDSDTGQDLAMEVREYHIPDFSDWKDHDKFEAAFSRLLNDLKNK